MMFRSLLGLTVLAAAGPALAAGPETVPTPQAAADPLAKLDRCLDRELPTLEAVPACEAAAGLASHLNPGERAALSHRRGEIELRRGRAAEAVVFLETARQLEPEVAPYALTLGDALAASGETARAVAVYREGERLAPSSKVFHARLMALPSSPEAPISAKPALASPIVPVALPEVEPAVPPKPRIESAAPIQAVVHEFGQEFGERTVQAFYTRGESGTCELMVMTQQEPGPRVRVSLAPTQTATVEDVSGGKLGLTCGLDAAQLIVNRQPGSEDAIVRR